MKVARYIGNGQIAIVDEPTPSCPPGGLLVQTAASGLCSGELMDWYLDRKIPHVLGHEVSGVVIESQDSRFPVGARVFPHHHAPCLHCDTCRKGLHVHCEQWRATRLEPGGMAEMFAVYQANLSDTLLVEGLRAVDAALIEPLACVVKSFVQSGVNPACPQPQRYAVVGLGVMGLMHMLLLSQTLSPEGRGQGEGAPVALRENKVGGQLQAFGTPYPQPLSTSDAGAPQGAREALSPSATGYDLNPARVEWAANLGLNARAPDNARKADVIFVCPGTQQAVDFAVSIANPGARIVLFAPLPPTEQLTLDINELYFKDISLRTSYSCGPNDTVQALELIEKGRVKAEQVVSDFINIDELSEAYQAMKRGDILKPMVVFE